VIDLLKVDYPPQLIRDLFNLTDAQINAALAYIEENRLQIDTEYQQVLQTGEEILLYWEDRNREHLSKIATMPHQPGQAAFWATLNQGV
jgi:hypothetical protein